MFKRVLITSGPTLEPIDPVRFISNRSSGKTGAALARAARGIGVEEIIFISGPGRYLPDGVRLIPVETAREMHREVFRHREKAEVIIMAAAVSDYRCLEYSPGKIKKKNGRITLTLERNPDILGELGRTKAPGQLLVGFAAETGDGLSHARKKFAAKNLDLLVLNTIGPQNPVFGLDHNQVTLVWKNRHRQMERATKDEIARIIWAEICRLKEKPPPAQNG